MADKQGAWDMFAAAALQGALAAGLVPPKHATESPTQLTAKASAEVADALLAERDKRTHEGNVVRDRALVETARKLTKATDA